MKFGFVLPWAEARDVVQHARTAEAAGWDGLFVWEPLWGIDAWVSLGAAAMVTDRISLGTLISPLSRMRPWKIASESATLDRLTRGRTILAVGLGFLPTGFSEFGEVTDRRTRAELLDEALDIVTGLWRGQPFTYHGKHYAVRELDQWPPPSPVQQPRIPIWTVGLWPSRASMARALRYDGLLPEVRSDDGTGASLTPERLRPIALWIREHRTSTAPFEIVIDGETPTDDPREGAAVVGAWEDAGATWWIESRWNALADRSQLPEVASRIAAGPQRLSP